MMLKKNDICKIKIIDQDNLGQGIGKVDGFPVFVRHAVKGDIANVLLTKVKKGYAYGRIMELISPSELRKDPDCSIYKRCGGCQLQMMDYKAQLLLKQENVANCLKRIGGCDMPNILPILKSDEIYRYRNKAQYPVGTDKNGNTVCGFFAERSHEIIKCDDCLLTPSIFSAIVGDILKWMDDENIKSYNEINNKGIIRHIFIRQAFATEQISLCIVVNSDSLPKKDSFIKIMSKYDEIKSISISVNKKKSNVIMGDEIKLIYGDMYIEDKIGDVKFQISPMSFYQINPKQTRKLYDKVAEFADLSGNETVLDLYCGIGTIGLYAASKASKLIGIEIIHDAIEDAKINQRLNNVENAYFYTGKAEEILPMLYKQGVNKADVIIVDPPRKGCDENALSTICDISPTKIVYVSCNPATLARDVKFLTENGFKLEKVQPVDMFPNTVHVETVVLMSRISGSGK